MKVDRIVFNSSEMRRYLTHEVRGVVKEETEKAARKASSFPSSAPTKEYGSKVGTTDRARGIVFPKTPHAANSNAKHNTLVKIAGGGL